jgi:hypothetical protein
MRWCLGLRWSVRGAGSSLDLESEDTESRKAQFIPVPHRPDKRANLASGIGSKLDASPVLCPPPHPTDYIPALIGLSGFANSANRTTSPGRTGIDWRRGWDSNPQMEVLQGVLLSSAWLFSVGYKNSVWPLWRYSGLFGIICAMNCAMTQTWVVGSHRTRAQRVQLPQTLPHQIVSGSYARPPEHYGNKQYDLQYNSLGGCDEP